MCFGNDLVVCFKLHVLYMGRTRNKMMAILSHDKKMRYKTIVLVDGGVDRYLFFKPSVLVLS